MADHRANPTLLGSEAIDRTQFDDDARRLPGAEPVAQLVDEKGRLPPPPHGSRGRYDVTCRNLDQYCLRLRQAPG